jgi:ribosome biogenesis GTPase
VLAANVDTLLIANALDVQVNLRRIERFVAIARDGGVAPVVLLTKSDLPHDAQSLRDELRAHLPDVPVHFVSAEDEATLGPLETYFSEGDTVALVGLSGAGKSTLINLWSKGRALATGEVGSDGKGRHTTTSRTLHVRAQGGLILDTPGVREVGVLADEEGVAGQFEDIEALAARCRFGNCQHQKEPDCAVQQALRDGVLLADRWASFQRLTNEARGEGATRRRAPKR